MKQWSLTLHGPTGILSQFESGEAQFVLGTEEAPDVLTVAGEGIALRHAWVWLADARLQVEDLGGGTLVNGHPIEGRVEVEYPASVQVGSVTLVVEEKVAAVDISSAVTIPQRPASKRSASLSSEVTIVTRPRPQAVVSPESVRHPNDQAPITGAYTLVREIARGGMGQIYFGEDPQLKRQVAVKVSSISEGGEDPRFSKEAEVLAHLAHPNIVPIYNIGVDAQGRPFYSMKLVKGRTLQAVLNAIREGDAAAVKEYPRAALLTVFRKVCDAMAFAHAKGILHRDLKPENIMVGEYGEVLVMDWGLAKVLGGEEVLGGTEDVATGRSPAKDTGDYGMTMEGEVMGTPQYMSPEQAEGVVAELDARSDIYSLGGILYAILTLRPPIDGTSLNEVLTKVKRGEITSMVTKRGGKAEVSVGTPSAMGVEVPEALQAVTLKAMATDRNKRYASVEVFAGDIEAYQNGFATSAENAGALRQAVLFIKRNKGVAAAVAMMFVGAVLFMVRLAASERVALANAEAARLSEERAIEQKEVSRREAARAQLALAEAGENEADAIQMRSALDAVPEDLRDPTWRYMSERLDKSDLDISPAKGRVWLGLEDLPTEPDAMLALDNAGEVSSVNLITGEVKALWRASVPKLTASKFCVSKDGKVAAIGFHGGNLFHVQVYQISDGVMVGEFENKSSELFGISRMWTAGEILICYGRNNAAIRMEAWDIATGGRLWDRRGGSAMSAEFSPDQKIVYFLNPRGQLEQLDPRTGNTLSMRETVMRGQNANNPEGVAFSPDFSRVFIADGSNHLRHPLRMWSRGAFEFDSPTSGQGALFLNVMPKQGLVVGFCPGRGPGGVLEIRDWNTGYITKQIPILYSKILSGSGSAVRSKGNTVALMIREGIRVWRLESGLRKAALDSPIQGAYKVRSFGDAPMILASHFAGAGSLAATSCLVLGEADTDGMRTREVCRAEYKGFGVNRPPNIFANAKGDQFVAAIDGLATAFRLDDTGMHQLWKVQRIQQNGAHSCSLHPTLDFIWTGESVLDFSTGREKVRLKLNGFNGIGSGSTKNDVVWVGADRVLQGGYWGKSENDEGATSSPALEKSLVLWDVNSGEACLTVPAPRIAALCVSPDGTRIAEAGEDKRVRIRDAKTLSVLQEFRVHDNAVSDVVWHPTVPVLATLSWEDHSVRVWNLKDYRMLEEFTGLQEQGRMTISPNGRRLLVTEKKTVVFEPKSFDAQ